jgi:hypothetical protein
MDSETYAQLLGKLADALKNWASALFYNERLHDEIDREFSRFVEQARLAVLVKLGAERRGSLSEVIDTGLNRVKEQSKAFVAVSRRLRRRSYEDRYPRKFADYMGHQVSFPPKAVHAADHLWIKLNECDELFAAIDRAIRQADSLGSDEGNTYEPRFEPEGYLSKDLCDKLGGIKTATLNKYAKGAGLNTPKVGQRNYLYSFKDTKILCEYMIAKGSHGDIVKAAQQLLPEAENKLVKIENKSKDHN